MIHTSSYVILVSFVWCLLLSLGPIELNAFTSGVPLFGPPIHQEITSTAVGFLKPSVIEALAGSSIQPDKSLGIWDNAAHFDNCNFDGTITQLNSNYEFLINDFNPRITIHVGPIDSFSDAITHFGLILHAVEDFYSHSNYVELYRAGYVKGLVDNGLDKWKVLTAYSKAGNNNNTLVLEYNLSPTFIPHIESNHIIRITTAVGKEYYGLISGTFGSENHCPISIPHYGPNVSTPHFSSSAHLVYCTDPVGLNKDEPCRIGFDTAKSLATDDKTRMVQIS
jgi:hypothetical protein